MSALVHGVNGNYAITLNQVRACHLEGGFIAFGAAAAMS
jgi:hypothetical protein